MPPVVSIITVSFNAEAEIEKTIASVLQQSFTDYEYVFIDGASKDGTVSVIESYRQKFEDLGISYRVTSEKDRGIYDAMNKGVCQAAGQWVLMLNAGDRFADADVLRDVFSGTPESGKILYGDVVLRQVCGKKSYFRYQKPKAIESICHALPFCHQSVFVPRELMAQFGFDTDFKIAADYNFFARAYTSGTDFRYVPRAISVYDLTGVSSVNSEKLYKEYGRIQSTYFPTVPQDAPPAMDGPAAAVKRLIKRFLPSLVYSGARGWYASPDEAMQANR